MRTLSMLVSHSWRSERKVSRFAVSASGNGTRGVDGEDSRVIAIVHIRKPLGRRIIHAQVIHITTRRVCASKECPLSGEGQIARGLAHAEQIHTRKNRQLDKSLRGRMSCWYFDGRRCGGEILTRFYEHQPGCRTE